MRLTLGYTSDSFWLPDTFGYNAAIPQIMLESGVKYFFTTKMSWNDLNTFPAGSFVWKTVKPVCLPVRQGRPGQKPQGARLHAQHAAQKQTRVCFIVLDARLPQCLRG